MIETAEEFRKLRLSEDPSEYQRAAREEAPLEVWSEVIARFPELKIWVVHNKTVPLEILRVLANDQDVIVRERVACRRKLTEELFVLLAKDPSSSVRGTVAGNAKVPKHVLEQLKNDVNEWVSSEAKEALERRFSEG